ncbi:MAG: LamG-like jellyroll fold domain-containing protein [Pseudomonadota bacterium]
MRKTNHIVLCAAALLATGSAQAATPRHTFTFDTSLQNSESTQALISHGGSIEGGHYVFDINEGLSLTNALADPATYTIEMRVLMDDLEGGSYRKLIDFQERALDEGFYLRLGTPVFYPEVFSGLDALGSGEWGTLVLTRDSAGNMTIYLNGIEQSSFLTELGVSASNTLDFLRDDSFTSFSEASAGRLDYLRIYDGVLSAAEVSALAAPTPTVVERDLFAPGDGLLSYDPNTGNEWLDLTQTIDQSVTGINAGDGGWIDLGFRPATEAEVSALFVALGVAEVGPESENNVNGVLAHFNLLGCTFSCNTVGLDRANGISVRSGGGVRTSSVDLYYNNDPVTARAYFSGAGSDDYTNFTTGVYLVRPSTQTDSDNDGVGDPFDNCTEAFNVDQRDSNADGYGNVCDADLSNDGVVNAVDLGLLRTVFFTDDADADFNGDGTVNIVDLGIMRARFFEAPGPSGLAP